MASRTRSGMGLVLGVAGAANFRDPHAPPMILNCSLRRPMGDIRVPDPIIGHLNLDKQGKPSSWVVFCVNIVRLSVVKIQVPDYRMGGMMPGN